MERQLAAVGLAKDPRVAFFPAFKGPQADPFSCVGAYGCFLSHKQIISEAADANESVLILEDDCDFLPAIQSYEAPDFDVFYGGYIALEPLNLENSDIIGSHFMGFSAHGAKVAASYLSGYLSPDFQLGPFRPGQKPCAPSERPGIDGAYVWMRRAHPELKSTFAQVGVQRPSRTDIGFQRWFDKLPIARVAAGFARRFKSSSSKRGHQFG